jgi:hypothetical protein
VRLYQPDSIQSYVSQTDETGRFETWAVPGAGYRIEIVPFDPLLPIFTDEIGIGDPADDIDRDLGTGVPVYGVVSGPSGPVEGARIQLVDSFGAVSATAFSDAYGIYQVRATRGVWTVQCSGRDSGLDPTLRFADQTVGELGLNLDVSYPVPLDPVVAQGEVETTEGGRVRATVRLTAEALDGYSGLDASFSTEVYAAANGSFVGLVVPGTYTVEVIPPDEGDELSPLRLTGVPLAAGANLDTIALQPLVDVGGEVRGPAGSSIAAARVECSEVGFGGRAWEAFTGEQGRFSLMLPQVRVTCEAHPPGSRGELATGFISFDPTMDQSVGFDLNRGQFVVGKVITSAGGGEPAVVVDVRDQAGRVLGSGLTDGEGGFEIAVDLSTVAE